MAKPPNQSANRLAAAQRIGKQLAAMDARSRGIMRSNVGATSFGPSAPGPRGTPKPGQRKTGPPKTPQEGKQMAKPTPGQRKANKPQQGIGTASTARAKAISKPVLKSKGSPTAKSPRIGALAAAAYQRTRDAKQPQKPSSGSPRPSGGLNLLPPQDQLFQQIGNRISKATSTGK